MVWDMALARSAPFAVLALTISACDPAPGPSDAAAGRDDAAVEPDASVAIDAGPVDPGALVRVSIASQVGVLLEDLPAGADRDRAATEALAQPEAFWLARARMQLSATRLRLTYRRWFALRDGMVGKRQLPLPPTEGWELAIAGPARREMVDGHDVVVVDYTMRAMLVTDVESPGTAEAALRTVGGRWEEEFTFPVDPDLLFQRTGHACIRETLDVASHVDSENALLFYDDGCLGTATGLLNCHRTTGTWPESCDESLAAHVGRVTAPLVYERLPWDEATADAARIGGDGPETPDLEVIGEGLEVERVVWEYFAPDSCAIFEGCVREPGWRRLLKFDASLRNVGNTALDLGTVDGSIFEEHNVYEFSECHEHFHFRFYGDFTFGTGADERIGDKRAFCLLSTSRYENHERSPLFHGYDTCSVQGIAPGWGDDYYAGLDCQWIDVTEVDTGAGPVTGPLRFEANPDRFLCEGTLQTDAMGEIAFESTTFTTETGAPVDRPLCEFGPTHDANNTEMRDVLVSPGGMVTDACPRVARSPLRDCGFTMQPELLTCVPGETVRLSCSTTGTTPQALRLCEGSAELGHGIACLANEALATGLLAGAAGDVDFVCPAMRSATEPGGRYAIMTAAIFEGAPGTVTCTPR